MTKSSTPTIAPIDPTRCYGWRYDSCDMPPVFELTEYFLDGSWGLYTLCIKHARDAMNGLESESNPAAARVWRGL